MSDENVMRVVPLYVEVTRSAPESVFDVDAVIPDITQNPPDWRYKVSLVYWDPRESARHEVVFDSMAVSEGWEPPSHGHRTVVSALTKDDMVFLRGLRDQIDKLIRELGPDDGDEQTIDGITYKWESGSSSWIAQGEVRVDEIGNGAVKFDEDLGAVYVCDILGTHRRAITHDTWRSWARD